MNINLNPYRVFYVNKLPKKAIESKILLDSSLSRDAWFFKSSSFSKFEMLAKKLEQRKISGHNAIHTTRKVLSEFESSISEWLEKAILRKSIGIGSTSVNRVFGKIIPKFGVMLADNKQVNIDEVKFPVIIQPKLDGFRAVYIPEVGFIGRNGKHIKNKNIKEYFKGLSDLKDTVLDGELYSHNMSFNKLASLLNSEDKEISYGELEFIVFDSIPITGWREQNSTYTYSNRLKNIKIILDSIYTSHVKIIPNITLKKNIIKEVFEMYLQRGYEGAMLKDPKGLYKWKRVTVNSGILSKLKPSFSEDCKTTGFVEGEGKFTGMLGKLLVDFNGVTVGVGTGFSDKERKEIWKNKKKYLHKYVEVKGMEVTEDLSIRHPVFSRWRPDKDGCKKV